MSTKGNPTKRRLPPAAIRTRRSNVLLDTRALRRHLVEPSTEYLLGDGSEGPHYLVLNRYAVVTQTLYGNQVDEEHVDPAATLADAARVILDNYPDEPRSDYGYAAQVYDLDRGGRKVEFDLEMTVTWRKPKGGRK